LFYFHHHHLDGDNGVVDKQAERDKYMTLPGIQPGSA
jgi:hypothetical protein